MNTSIFKAYDVRGVYPADMNEQAAVAVAKACVRMLEPGEIVVAHDVRHGSPELAEAAAKAIESEAASLGKAMTVRRVGLSSTPMFYFLVNRFGASGGCMITASHNPKEYNGMKVVKRGAAMIPGSALLEFITKNNLA